MKRSAFRLICSLALCLILLAGVIPPVRAAGDTTAARAAILQAYEDLEAVDGRELTLDLEQYHLTVEELTALVVSTGLYGDCTQPWYLDSFTYRYYESNQQVRSVTFVRKDPLLFDYDAVNQKIAEILNATIYDGMSQWQMVLSIHDYLVSNCVYDETYTYRAFYDVVTRGTAVCSGYAETMVYLLREVGIPCRYISSESMNHAWNLVQLNGEWYHLDSTWNDPTSDVHGRVLHSYFLLSDDAISDENHAHYGWDSPFECTDTSRDTGRFWQEIDSAICYESADICYFRQETDAQSFAIYRRDREGNQTLVTTQKTGFVNIGAADGYRYYYATYGLSLVEGKLYYSDMEGVYRINTDGTGKETIYAHNCDANKSYILGSVVTGGKIHLTLSTQDGTRSAMTLDLPGGCHVHSYTAQVVPPTCTSIGYTIYSCPCGLHYQGQKKPMADHVLINGTVIREAAVGQSGLKQYSCAHCDYTETETIPPLADPELLPLDPEDWLEDETVQRILIGVGVVALLLVFRRKK